MSETIQRRPAQRERLVEPEPTPPISLGAPDATRGARWGQLLVWFMRAVALLWIVVGLSYWVIILEPGGAGAGDFPRLPIAAQATIVFFATINLVAAVGLWLMAPWGGVVWLFTALVEILLAVFHPAYSFARTAALAFDGALIGAYFVLNFFAARERETL